MIFRETQITDIPQIQIVRNSVKENTLSDPALVPDKDVEDCIKASLAQLVEQLIRNE